MAAPPGSADLASRLAVNLHATLDARELDILLSYSRVVDFGSDEFIVYQGRRSEGVYVVVSGVVSATAKVVGPSAGAETSAFAVPSTVS